MLSGITTRVKVLFLLTLITGAIAGWTLLSKGKSGKPVYTDFIAIDTTDIVKVAFTVAGETHYVAPKNNAVWFIASKYDVRKDIITTMTLGLARMDVKILIASEVKAAVKKRLLSEGVQVDDKKVEGKKEMWVLTHATLTNINL